MLTDKDVEKLIEVFATRKELEEKFVTKEEFRKAISNLHSAIDAYARKADTYT